MNVHTHSVFAGPSNVSYGHSASPRHGTAVCRLEAMLRIRTLVDPFVRVVERARELCMAYMTRIESHCSVSDEARDGALENIVPL